MSNYKEKTTSGEVVRYLAAKDGGFKNPYGGVPYLWFNEVERTVLNGVLISEIPTGRVLNISCADIPKDIPFITEDYVQIRDESGNIVEGQSITDSFFAYLLACVYIDSAVKRDIEDANKPVPSSRRRRIFDSE